MRNKTAVPIFVLFLSLIFILPLVYAETQKKKDPVIEAFKEHPKIKEIMKATGDSTSISFHSVLISMSAGIRGASSSHLVVMHIVPPSHGTNQFPSRSIMATVDGNGRSFSVTSFVELKPIEEDQVR